MEFMKVSLSKISRYAVCNRARHIHSGRSGCKVQCVYMYHVCQEQIIFVFSYHDMKNNSYDPPIQ